MTDRNDSRVFGWLLRLFPRHFRESYGEGMREVFADQVADARRTPGLVPLAGLWWRTLRRMPVAAWRERRAGHTTRARGTNIVESIVTDVRLTTRALTRAPLFTLVTVSVVAIGIGAVATIFSALNAMVLRPIPGTTDGDRLYTIDRRSQDLSEGVSMSGALFRHIRTTAHTLDDAAVWSRVQLSLLVENQTVALPGSIVSDNYFRVLGLPPAAGRFFDPDDSRAAVVISHRVWVRHFAQDPGAVGSVITINGRPYHVIGVTPEGFRGVFSPLRIDAWVPLSAQPHVRPGRDLEHAPWLWMFGRVADGVGERRAQAELQTIVAAWASAPGTDNYPKYTTARFTPLTGLPDDARRGLLQFGGLLMGAAVLVLLVAGANASSLLAMRAHSRRHELGLRTALGAGRAQLVRQLMTETLMLFVLGTAGGVLFAWAATSAFESYPIPGDAAIVLELSPDLRVIAFAALAGLLAGLVFGVGPALRGTAHAPALLIRTSTAGSGSRRAKIADVLIVAQLAGSLILLSTTALFVRALERGASIDPGFRTEGVTTAVFNTESYGYSAERGREFYDSLQRSLTRAPGVVDVAFAHVAPLVSLPSGAAVTVRRPDGAHQVTIRHTVVGDGFFRTLDVPLLRGREFDDRDRAESARVAVVNEVFARRAWPERADVLGLTFEAASGSYTVVGIAGDVKFGTLEEPEAPFVYFALAQRWRGDQTAFVRTVPGTPRIDMAIVDAARGVDATVPAPAIFPLADSISVALFAQRTAVIVTSVLGAGALLLACAGLYGAIAYVVAARGREIGVRMALGASQGAVLTLFLRQGLRLTLAGVALGLAGSAGAAQLASGFLLGGQAVDTGAFSAAAALLTMVATLAVLIPSRRATMVDPVAMLR